MLRIKRRSPLRNWRRASGLVWLRRLIIFLVVVGVLAGLSLVGYRFYQSLNTDPPVAVTYRNTGSGETNKPYFSPVNIQPKHIPQEIVRGEETTLSVTAGKNVTCSVLVAGGTSERKQGLYTKKTDSKGQITWEWDVKSSVQLGLWPLEITCKNPQHQAKLRRTIKVVDPSQQ